MGKKETKEEAFKTMYLGPSIKQYGLVPGVVYESYPVNVTQALKDHPDIKNLMFPVDQNLLKVKANIKTKGTREYILYNILKKELGGNK